MTEKGQDCMRRKKLDGFYDVRFCSVRYNGAVTELLDTHTRARTSCFREPSSNIRPCIPQHAVILICPVFNVVSSLFIHQPNGIL